MALRYRPSPRRIQFKIAKVLKRGASYCTILGLLLSDTPTDQTIARGGELLYTQACCVLISRLDPPIFPNLVTLMGCFKLLSASLELPLVRLALRL